MLVMLAGLVLFLGAHSLPMAPALRAGLQARLGTTAYRIGFTFVSVLGIILIARGFVTWKYVDGAPLLYVPPTGLRHFALLLMLLSFISLAAMYGTSHIRKVLKHPMLVGVKLWAVAHLMANGDLADVVLFGAILAWAVADRISVKRRERAGTLKRPDFVPTVKGDIVAVAAGVIVYVLFVWKVHLWLIGVSPLAM